MIIDYESLNVHVKNELKFNSFVLNNTETTIQEHQIFK